MYSRPESDEAMIRRLLPSSNTDRDDRAQAWAEWQETAAPHLYAFVRTHNNTRETDEDLVQDALITAYLGVERGAYRPHEGVPFTAYVKGIARNKIREARRRARRLVDWDDDLSTLVDEIHARRSGAVRRQPEDRLERREQRELVSTSLSGLPPARQQVLTRFLSGETTDQIAAQMAISEELVRQHKCRGLKALKQRAGMEAAGWIAAS